MMNNCQNKCNNFPGQVWLFTRQFLNPLHLLLLLCALVSALVGHYAATLIALVSILFVCTLSYAKEFRLYRQLQQQQLKEDFEKITTTTTTTTTAAAEPADDVTSADDSSQLSEVLPSVGGPTHLLLANVDQLSEYLVVSHCFIIALITMLGIIQQRSPQELAYYALSLAILAIPEGLPVLLAGLDRNNGGSNQCVYHRIHNFLVYQSSISLASVALIAISLAARTDPPLSAIHLLYINILADGPQAQSLGTEQLSDEELSMWPRTIHDPLVSWRLLGTTLALTSTLVALNGALYAYLLDSNGHLDGHARALLFACFVFCTAFATLALRSKFKTIFESRIYTNLELLFCCTATVLLQICLTQIGALNELLQVDPLAALELLYVLLYASLVLLVMDCLKVLARLLDHGRRLFIKLAHRLQVPTAPFADSFYSTSSLAKANKFTNSSTNSGSGKNNNSSSTSSGSSGIGSSNGSHFDSLAAGRFGASPLCTSVTPLPSLTHNGSAHF